MKNILLIILYIYFQSLPLTVFSKPVIITTITPIASILQMLTKDYIRVESIITENFCPHHYQLRLNDLQKLNNADVLIYLDDMFDGFFLTKKHVNKRNIVKISTFNKLKIIKDNSINNWHIWLDLENVKVLLDEFSIILKEFFPQIQGDIMQNLVEAKKQIDLLNDIKEKKLSKVVSIVLLSRDLEYFFLNKGRNIYNKYHLYHSTIKNFNYLNNLAKQENLCIIINSNQNINLYKRFKKKVIQLEGDNWKLNNTELKDSTGMVFINRYLKMINQVSSCKDD